MNPHHHLNLSNVRFTFNFNNLLHKNKLFPFSFKYSNDKSILKKILFLFSEGILFQLRSFEIIPLEFNDFFSIPKSRFDLSIFRYVLKYYNRSKRKDYWNQFNIKIFFDHFIKLVEDSCTK